MRGFKTILSAGFLASALVLAGCGGGSNDGGMDDNMPKEMTPQEKCAAMGQGYAIDSDGECKSLDEARQEGADTEGDKRDQEDAKEQAAEDAAAMRKLAMRLRDILADSSTTPFPTASLTAAPDAFKNAKDDEKSRMSLTVMGDAFEEAHSNLNPAEGVYTISTAGTHQTNVMGKYIAGSAFSTGSSKSHDTAIFDDDGTPKYRFTTGGSYHGVSGTYVCTHTAKDGACSSVLSADGNLMLAGAGTWTFQPGNPKDMVSDSDGAEWGWWVTKNTAGDIATVNVFYSASNNSAGLTTFGGKATYSGNAIGKYAINRGAGAENDAGHFTADAMLEADFSVGSTDGAKVKGMINNFMGADGKDRDWTVELKEVAATGAGAIGATAGTTVWTMGGVEVETSEAWRGQFYGAENTTPSSAAGAFKASHGGVGEMVGAFGASKDN